MENASKCHFSLSDLLEADVLLKGRAFTTCITICRGSCERAMRFIWLHFHILHLSDSPTTSLVNFGVYMNLSIYLNICKIEKQNLTLMDGFSLGKFFRQASGAAARHPQGAWLENDWKHLVQKKTASDRRKSEAQRRRKRWWRLSRTKGMRRRMQRKRMRRRRRRRRQDEGKSKYKHWNVLKSNCKHWSFLLHVHFNQNFFAFHSTWQGGTVQLAPWLTLSHSVETLGRGHPNGTSTGTPNRMTRPTICLILRCKWSSWETWQQMLGPMFCMVKYVLDGRSSPKARERDAFAANCCLATLSETQMIHEDPRCVLR